MNCLRRERCCSTSHHARSCGSAPRTCLHTTERSAPEARRAATLHLGGTLEEIDHGRMQECAGQPAERPYVLVVQPTLFDPSRAPTGKHVGWAYCHVPNGSTFDMTERLEGQVERFAPGFRDRILARHVMRPADLERHNSNLVGGDITGGEATLLQLFFRPSVRPIPYATPNPRLFICSSSTPSGGGVHGMSGYYAARVALRRRFSPTGREAGPRHRSPAPPPPR